MPGKQRRRSILAMTSLAVAARATRAGAEGPTVRFDFEDVPVGQLPPGVITGLTGGGGPVKWSVIEDKTAPVGPKALAQTSADRTDYRFPLAIFDQTAKDAMVTVRFKAVSGEVDRAAGIALRLSDANNYYVVRANALEDNVRLYRVVAGKRIQFAGADVKVPSGIWHQLGLDVRGNRFEVLFNGKSLYSATDSTFARPGHVALWTKADSVTYFDELIIKP
ncbi:MAG: hypothetical protein ISP49_13025 [Reyranella sp.]|jgi:hypothetical protein|nr:hypothetical protein [Reyranella sp.]MBL6652513.1 hypothetical protein [Reyranella sp.]